MVPGKDNLSDFFAPRANFAYSRLILFISLAPTALFLHLLSVPLAHPTSFPARWPLTTLALQLTNS